MTLIASIVAGISLLRKNGQRITQDHTLYLSSDGTALVLAAIKSSSATPDVQVAVKIPYQSDSVFAGCLPGTFHRLFKALATMTYQWNHQNQDDTDVLEFSGDTFKYRLNLKSIAVNIAKIVSFAIDEPVDSKAIIGVTNKHLGSNMIVITGNYFQDLAAAIEAGAIVKTSAKNPTKADLYAAIEAHNAAVAQSGSAEPTSDENEVYKQLLSQWKEKKAAKTAVKDETPKRSIANRGVSGKSLDKSEVWPSERIRVVRRTSQMGLVLSAMFEKGSICLEDGLTMGLTRNQFSQAIGSISEAGYGIAKSGRSFSVILPEDLAAPKLK